MRLSYLKAYGRNGLQGQWWPGDADSRREPRRAFTEGSGWELSIEAAITHLLPALGATHALLSVGGMHVPERSPLVEAEFRAWQRAFDNTSVFPTWKTYTWPRDEKDTPVASRYSIFSTLVRSCEPTRPTKAASTSTTVDTLTPRQTISSTLR